MSVQPFLGLHFTTLLRKHEWRRSSSTPYSKNGLVSGWVPKSRGPVLVAAVLARSTRLRWSSSDELSSAAFQVSKVELIGLGLREGLNSHGHVR